MPGICAVTAVFQCRSPGSAQSLLLLGRFTSETADLEAFWKLLTFPHLIHPPSLLPAAPSVAIDATFNHNPEEQG